MAVEKFGRKAKFCILAGLNLANLKLYINHTHSFQLLIHVRMEEQLDFVLKRVAREYHAYLMIWEAVVGEELPCKAEGGNRSF